MSIDIDFQLLDPRAKTPSKATEGSAGFDLYALEGGHLECGERKLVKTGVAMALEPYTVGLVCSRSGLALKEGVAVLNAPGIIDEDYRGELGVILINLGQKDFWFDAGTRIAQLVILRAPQISSFVVNELPATDRGSGGFGSTGA